MVTALCAASSGVKVFRLFPDAAYFMKKILLVFAHPDDESIATGGTVAKYVKAGWRVDLVCATKGEAGNSGQYNVSGSALGSIRVTELREAARILGISDTKILDSPDGKLATLTPGTLEDPLYRSMESGLPDVVLTFDQTGVSNHPDHIKVCYATTFAFQKYAGWLEGIRKMFRVAPIYDQTWVKRLEYLLNSRVEPKLYYACLPRSVTKYLQKMDTLPKLSFGKPWVGVPDKVVTTIIDISKYTAVKKRALAAHISQREDFIEELQLQINPEFLKEFYILRMEGTNEHFVGKNDRIGDRL